MPVTYQIDQQNAIIRTKCSGNVTLDEVIQHFVELERDPNCPGHLDVVLDLTEQTSLPRSDQLRAVSWKISSIRKRVQFGACAIAAPTDALFGMIRMFQVFVEDYFRELAVFRTLDEAEGWVAKHHNASQLPPAGSREPTSG